MRGIHKRLHGTDPDTGEDFRLDRPDLLLWVHCCEVDSFLSTAVRAGAPITPDDADATSVSRCWPPPWWGSRTAGADLRRRDRPVLPGRPSTVAHRRGQPRHPGTRCAADAQTGAVADRRPGRPGPGWPAWPSHCCPVGPASCTRCQDWPPPTSQRRPPCARSERAWWRCRTAGAAPGGQGRPRPDPAAGRMSLPAADGEQEETTSDPANEFAGQRSRSARCRRPGSATPSTIRHRSVLQARCAGRRPAVGDQRRTGREWRLDLGHEPGTPPPRSTCAAPWWTTMNGSC